MYPRYHCCWPGSLEEEEEVEVGPVAHARDEGGHEAPEEAHLEEESGAERWLEAVTEDLWGSERSLAEGEGHPERRRRLHPGSHPHYRTRRNPDGGTTP